MRNTLTFNGMVPLLTIGFRGLNPDVQGDIMYKAFKRISPNKPDMIVFYPEGEREETLEDEGRTLITTQKGLTAKVYAKLDDFGSPEALKENMGEYAPKGNIQHVLTFMLAEEY